MKLKKITFQFENCDDLTIDGKYIGDFIVDDIETSVKRIACNSIRRIDAANTFVVEIHKDADQERYQFDQTQIEFFKQTVFKRLTSHNDITSIQFTLVENYPEEEAEAKEEEYAYYLRWTGESDNENASQKSMISELGHLYLVVSANKSIEDYFSRSNMNDEDMMNFQFSICDVGDKYSKVTQ